MLIDSALAMIFWSIAILFGLIFFARRWRWRRNRRKGKRRLGFYPNAAAVGNALQALQAIMEPQIEHVLEKKLDESVDEDDSGDDEDPVAHLHRQAARIRRGEPLECIIVRLAQKPLGRGGEEADSCGNDNTKGKAKTRAKAGPSLRSG